MQGTFWGFAKNVCIWIAVKLGFIGETRFSLRRRREGEEVGNRERANLSRRRAFGGNKWLR